MKKFLSHSLVFLVLFTTSASATHLHFEEHAEDHGLHAECSDHEEECSLCSLGFSEEENSALALETNALDFFQTETKLNYSSPYIVKNFYCSFLSRAPPA